MLCGFRCDSLCGFSLRLLLRYESADRFDLLNEVATALVRYAVIQHGVDRCYIGRIVNVTVEQVRIHAGVLGNLELAQQITGKPHRLKRFFEAERLLLRSSYGCDFFRLSDFLLSRLHTLDSRFPEHIERCVCKR